MRKLMIFCTAAILMSTTSAVADYDVDEGFMDAMRTLFNSRSGNAIKEPVTQIDVMTDGSTFSFVLGEGGQAFPLGSGEPRAVDDDPCWELFEKRDTYYEGSVAQIVWCQESDYDPDDRHLQIDLYVGDSPLARLGDDVECTISEEVPTDAYQKLCVSYELPRK